MIKLNTTKITTYSIAKEIYDRIHYRIREYAWDQIEPNTETEIKYMVISQMCKNQICKPYD